MRPYRFGLIVMLFALAGQTQGQLLRGNTNFPILKDLQWESTLADVQKTCNDQRVPLSITDTNATFELPMLGFAARTEVAFDRSTQRISQFYVRFSESTQVLVDSISNYFTRLCKHEPYRASKEKSLLIITFRMDLAVWKTQTDAVTLITARRGDTYVSAYLRIAPPPK